MRRVRYEFNRPFLEAKQQQEDDALAVESTANALSAIFLMEGGAVTFTQEKIVQWLNTMRLGTGGFVSTVDTVAALRALVTYSYHSRIRVRALSVQSKFNAHVIAAFAGHNLTVCGSRLAGQQHHGGAPDH